MAHKYTVEQSKFILDNYYGKTTKELVILFNAQFGTHIKYDQLRAYKKNRKLSSGVVTKFKRGHAPANKGIKGAGGWEPTQFKKGHRPYNYQAVGTERINGDGYIDIKIADPNKWRGKHILIWEKHNGPIPKGHVVIFGDRNKRNFYIDNLLLISRKQLLMMNRKNLIQSDTELTKTGIIIADIENKINEINKLESGE